MYHTSLSEFLERTPMFKTLSIGQTAVCSLLIRDTYLDDDNEEYIYDEKTEEYVPWIYYCYENVSLAINCFNAFCRKHYAMGLTFGVSIGSDDRVFFCEVSLVLFPKIPIVESCLN